MFTKARALVLAAVAATGMTGATAASASILYASHITVGATTVNTPVFTTNRGDLGNALGAPDATQSPSFRGFYSLGLGGSATFGFGASGVSGFGAPGSVVEITAGSRSGHVEQILVEAFNVVTKVWDNIGVISNQGPQNLSLSVSLNLAPGAVYNLLRLTDQSPVVAGRDGFDIDSISVAAVPLPAGGLLLIGALGGLALLRRRKAAQA